MLLKIHRSYRNVVALCDTNLLGKKFEEGKKQLEMREHFFKGEEVTAESAFKILKEQFREDATFNIVGEESIQTAIKADIITRDSVGNVQGVPFALKLL